MKQFKNILFWIGAALTLVAFFRLFRKPQGDFRQIPVYGDLQWDDAKYRSDADLIESALQGLRNNMTAVLNILADYNSNDLGRLYNVFGTRRLSHWHFGWPYTGIAGKDGDLMYWLKQESNESQWLEVQRIFKPTGLT